MFKFSNFFQGRDSATVEGCPLYLLELNQPFHKKYPIRLNFPEGYGQWKDSKFSYYSLVNEIRQMHYVLSWEGRIINIIFLILL